MYGRPPVGPPPTNLPPPPTGTSQMIPPSKGSSAPPQPGGMPTFYKVASQNSQAPVPASPSHQPTMRHPPPPKANGPPSQGFVKNNTYKSVNYLSVLLPILISTAILFVFPWLYL